MKTNKNNPNNPSGGGGNFSCRHPKLWEYIKSNVKAFFITGAIVFTITASATTVRILHSRQVRYKNDKSVEQAINELYEKADEIKYAEMNRIGCERCIQLEYIESTGTQYIDTDYLPKTNTKVELELKFGGKWTSRASCSGVFGSINGEDNNIFSVNFGSTQYYQFYVWVDKVYDKGGKIYTLESITDEMKQNKNKLVVQSGLATYSTLSKNIATKTTNNDFSLVLFGSNKKGTVCSFNAYTNMYVYSFKIYEGNILKRDYIPVLDKNERPCLFDKVSKTCFYNQGTGEFLYG